MWASNIGQPLGSTCLQRRCRVIEGSPQHRRRTQFRLLQCPQAGPGCKNLGAQALRRPATPNQIERKLQHLSIELILISVELKSNFKSARRRCGWTRRRGGG